jgi:hypothetical protein
VTVVSQVEGNTITRKKEEKMKFDEFRIVLADNPSAAIHLVLPDQARIKVA